MSNAVSIRLVDRDVVLTRVFTAPRPLVFECWTDPDHVAVWFGPHMMARGRSTSDRTEGGRVSIVMIDPDGTNYPMSGVITAWDPPKRVSYRMDLAGHPPGFHEMIRTTFDQLRDGRAGQPTNQTEMIAEFADHPEGTLLTLTMRFDSEIERDVHATMGMNEGWSESFEKLDRILAEKRS